MADKSSIEIGGDYDDLEEALGESEQLFDEFGEHIEQSASVAESTWQKAGDAIREVGGMVASAWQAVTEIIEQGFNDIWANIKKGTQNFIEMTRDIDQLGNMIHAMGHSVGYTLNGLEQMSDALKGISVNGQDAIRAAQLTLLQFRNVRGDVFKDAIKSAMDFAATMGGSLSSAAEHYGKLLQDPIEGLKDLAQSGTKFTEQQLRMIEAMEKANDMMGLQRMILAKLSEQYHGAAENQANTLWGALERLNNIFDDIYRTIGSLLAPTLTNKLIPIMEKVAKVVHYLVDQASQGGDFIGDAFDKAIEVAKEWGEVLLSYGVKVFAVLQTAVQNWGTTWAMIWTGAKMLALEVMAYVLEKMLELADMAVGAWKQ